MHFQDTSDYWTYTRWINRRLTLDQLRTDFAEIGIEDHRVTYVMHKMEQIAYCGALDIFSLSSELGSDEMHKLLELWYRKWYSMSFTNRPQENWRKRVDFGQEIWP